jgi:excisionase family DNA binding protein
MTVKEAAKELNCSLSFVYKLLRTGQLAYEKRGRRKLPIAASVDEYRQRNIVPVAEPSSRPAASERSGYVFKHLFQRVKSRPDHRGRSSL